MSSEPVAVWRDGVVRFPSLADFRAELAEFLSKGALRATGESLPEPLTEFDFELRVPEGETISLRGMIVASSPGSVLIQILDFDRQIAKRLSAISAQAGAPPGAPTASDAREQAGGARAAAPAAPAPAAPVRPWPEQPADLRRLSGEIRNPGAVPEIALLPTAAIVSTAELESTSTIALIRFLAAHKATGTLTLETEAEHRLPITGGVYQLARRERDNLLEPMFAAEGKFLFVSGKPTVTSAQKAISAWSLVAQTLRIWLRQYDVEALREVVPLDNALTLHPGFAGLARTLRLTSAEGRLVEREFDGEAPLATIIRRNALTDRSVLQLAFSLYALGLVQLVEAHEAEAARASGESLQEECERLAKADLFTAIGVHWSAPQSVLDERMEELRAEFGPDSEAHASTPKLAAERLALAEKAYEDLATVAHRRRYRESLGINAEAASKLLLDQVRLMRGRGEIREALEHLSAAVELYPSAEAAELVRKLRG